MDEYKNKQLFLMKDAPRFSRRIYLAWHETGQSSDMLASLARQLLDRIAGKQATIMTHFVDNE